ncbi:CHRD domain-containing protein [Rufibacter sediminis]|uniref:CHRD domain-containing protein n=1 Tax=Rufibacter sediminis TaxID=2762756 RepID=A0ABR6VV56_9BACT|nr:CHRD domain-containing protein [Rufibacter sediminis]MBC3541046.1 CHRD domain-containing protein [Rufibacter sediminis]
MKTTTHLFRLAFGLFVTLSFALASCSSDDDDDDQPSNIVQLQNSTLTPDQEEHTVISTATGTFSGTYDRTTKIITYNISWNGITPINMHFHRGELKKSGPVVIPIDGPYTSAITNAKTPPLTEAQETEMLAGLWYVNVHSDQYKNGEIRGQVRPQ